MAGDASVVARAFQAQAERVQAEAVNGTGIQAAVKMILAQEYRQIAAAVSYRIGSESDLAEDDGEHDPS